MTDPSREPSFLHPIDSVNRDGAHRSRSSHPSLNSTSSWVYHNQQNPPPPPPPEPIPVPSPSRNALGVSELQDEDEFEGMDINVADIESGTMHGRRVESPLSANGQKRDRNFVGGFVSGLRRLPRTVMKGYGYGRGQGGDKKRKGTLDTSATSGTGNTLPRYQTTAPEPEAGPSNVVYVEATSMPTARPATINRRPNRPSLRISNPTEIPDVNHDPLPIHVPEMQDAEITSGQCDPLPPPVRPENILDGGITASPVLVEPRRASDYAKMDSPAPGPPSEPSLGTQINRVQKFLHDIGSLPWVAGERLTVDYRPGLTRGGKPRSYERPPDPKPVHRPPESWYHSPHHNSVDLLSGASSPISTRARPERHHPRRQASADMYRRETSPIIPSPYPFQLPYQYPYPVPIAPPSSHQRAHASPHPGSGRSTPHSPGSERHRQTTYPTYPHGYSPYSPLPPQPFYVVQGGSGSVSGLHMQQAQALPLYVVATTPVSFSPPSLDHAADNLASPSQHHSRSSPIPRPPPAQTT